MVALKIKYFLPSPRQVKMIQAAGRKGVKRSHISKCVFGTPHRTNVVNAVLADPEMYDPHLDDIAVERALNGDLGVWFNLTHYERREVLLRCTGVVPYAVTRKWGLENSGGIGAVVHKMRLYAPGGLRYVPEA